MKAEAAAWNELPVEKKLCRKLNINIEQMKAGAAAWNELPGEKKAAFKANHEKSKEIHQLQMKGWEEKMAKDGRQIKVIVLTQN